MFMDNKTFNRDLSRWFVRSTHGSSFGQRSGTKGVSMNYCFDGATAFNQQLGGEWTMSLWQKRGMFGMGCPGSIEGMTNDRWGTPRYTESDGDY